MIVLLTSINFSANASSENLTVWKKVYYDFLTDYTRLYPDMDSELIRSGDLGNPDFINGRKIESEEFYPLYHKSENIKLLNITYSPIPEIAVVNYGNFTGEWTGSSNYDSNVQVYKYEDGKVKKIFETSKNLLGLHYKQTEEKADLIIEPRYPQYGDDTDDWPQISNLIWNEQKQELENIINEELTQMFYSSPEGLSDPNYFTNYFEDKGYKRLFYIDEDTNTIKNDYGL